ncbi:MAG: hypothetical protein ACHQAQ_11355 [Hyphomicrobiales bacterium]
MGGKPPNSEEPLSLEEGTKRIWEGTARLRDESDAAIAHCRVLLARWLRISADEDVADAGAGKSSIPFTRSGSWSKLRSG